MTDTVIPMRRAPHNWPASMDAAALHGPVGELVRVLEPQTEADPVALLVQSLVAYGSVIGRGAWYEVEATRHHANEFLVLVGDSSRARKGSSLSQVLAVFAPVCAQWSDRCVASGLASGEGLVWRLRDRDGEEETRRQAEDKRLLSLETEFASVLRAARRPDSTLSANVRNAWDGRTLETMSKVAPARAAGAHVSIIGHITRDELLRNVDVTEVANGFLNRFIHIAVRSSKHLPFGGSWTEEQLSEVRDALDAAITHGRAAGRIQLTEAARELWPDHYARLRDGHPGLLGDICGRAEAHVMRLALIYALLDCAPAIDAVHLQASLALWSYAEASSAWVYGRTLGDPLADELWGALSQRPEGMSRTELRDLFSRNKRRADIDRALGVLQDANLVHCLRLARAGGPATEVWSPTGETG